MTDSDSHKSTKNNLKKINRSAMSTTVWLFKYTLTELVVFD
jgi:hypothetical protein